MRFIAWDAMVAPPRLRLWSLSVPFVPIALRAFAAHRATVF